MSRLYYAIGSSSAVKDYLRIGGNLEDIRRPCAMSEFQFLDRKPIRVELDKSSGSFCQDFIYERGIPLASERLKDFFDEQGLDYLFFKKIILVKSDVGIEEPYWLALPPRINCLNREKSEIDSVTGAADQIVIDESRIGRYKLFKLAGVTNLEIIVTEEFAEVLKKKKFTGMHIFKI